MKYGWCKQADACYAHFDDVLDGMKDDLAGERSEVRGTRVGGHCKCSFHPGHISFATDWQMIGRKSSFADQSCRYYLFEMVGSRGSPTPSHLKSVVLLNYVRDAIISDN